MNTYGNASEGLRKMFIAQVCLYHMQRAVSTMVQIIVQLFYATFLSRSSAALSK